MHRNYKKKNLNILLIPDNEASPKSFRIRYSTLKVVLALIAIFLISVIYGVISYNQVWQAALKKDVLERENTQLKEQLTKAMLLREELNEVQAYKDRVVNSFEGFVKYAEDVDSDELLPDNIGQSESKRSSILTSVPLVTPVTGFLSQEYHWPTHNGIDIVAPIGTPIKASADGNVVFSDYTSNAGHLVVLHHAGGYLTFYHHNSRNLVQVNQVVQQGDVIAFLGNSGESSSGPHLHFEIWKDGVPVNPREMLVDLKLGE